MCTGPAGLDAASGVDGVTVYHAGTAAGAEGTVTSGGRVLAVTGQAGCLKDAVGKAYEGVAKISFAEDGAQFRTDIAYQALPSI